MFLSDDFSHLDQLLKDAGASGSAVRVHLVRRFSELIQQLSSRLETDLQSSSSVAEAPAPELDSDSGSSPQASSLALSEYGDEASLHQTRMEALQIFDTRRLDEPTYVVLWMDTFLVWGRPLLLCMAVTAEGTRHILGFVEATVQDTVAVQNLLCGFLDRGLCVKEGVLCVVPGSSELSQLLSRLLSPHVRLQHCQLSKRTRVLSYLPDEDRIRIRGAFTRAYAHPEPEQARTALMQIHTELQHLNRSAATWMLHDLEQTLTLHQSGVYERLSSSLQSTRCIAWVGQYLSRRLRGVRHWLAPQTRRAQFALLCLEREAQMRRLAHASYLLPMRTALFADRNETE